MKGFTPGLLDRLMNERADHSPINAEQLKASVARDLEALLNTRVAVEAALLEGFPAARASILRYGLVDFAALCLTSSLDRAAICAGIEAAIATHEPRLCEVKAVLEPDAGDVNRLHFAIHARLNVDGLAEPVNFNAVLQPSSLQYEIRQSSRSAPAPRG